LNIQINNKQLILLNVYGPNNDNIKLFNILETFVSENVEQNIIIGGDFNTVLNPLVDKKNGISDKKCQTILNNSNLNYGLTNSWRENNPSLKHFNWHSNTKPVVFSRLDVFLISEHLLNTVPKYQIKPGFKKDHSAVILSLNICDQKRGPGYFKINSMYVNDNDYQNEIKAAVKETIETNINCNANTKWEQIKGTLGKFNVSITYSTCIKKIKNGEKKKYTNILKIYRATKNNDSDLEKLNTRKQELNAFLTDKINGMILRSKAHYVDNNEKTNSRYFENLEKRHYEQKLSIK